MTFVSCKGPPLDLHLRTAATILDGGAPRVSRNVVERTSKLRTGLFRRLVQLRSSPQQSAAAVETRLSMRGFAVAVGSTRQRNITDGGARTGRA